MTWSFGVTVTVHKHGEPTTDVDGNDVPTFTDVEVEDVALYPLDASELLERGATNIDYRRMVRLGGLDINALDEVTTDGVRWQVDGQPQPYDSVLTGTELGSVVLKRVTG